MAEHEWEGVVVVSRSVEGFIKASNGLLAKGFRQASLPSIYAGLYSQFFVRIRTSPTIIIKN